MSVQKSYYKSPNFWRNLLSVVLPVLLIISLFLILINEVTKNGSTTNTVFCILAFIAGTSISVVLLCFLSTQKTYTHLSIAYLVLALLYAIYLVQQIMATEAGFRGLILAVLIGYYLVLLLVQYIIFRLVYYLYNRYTK